MTAIAGLFDIRGRHQARQFCDRAIASQRRFAKRPPTFADLDNLCLAAAISDFLPEEAGPGQPHITERFALVADARIDNREELSAALGSPRVASDSLLLLAAWERWQEDCLHRLVGPFAVACFDRHEQSLTLARDPLGERPLFFQHDDGALRFASMPSGVLAGSKPKPNQAALSARLGGSLLQPSESFFAGVYALAPGQIAQFDQSGLRVLAGGQSVLLERTVRSEQQWVEEFRFLLDQAVANQLRTAAPKVATQLSSGYDSSAVTCTAARHLDASQLIAFTAAPVEGAPLLVSANRSGDESGIAAATAHALGIEHIIVHQRQSLFEALDGAAWAYQEPLANLFNVGWWTETLRKAAEHGATSMLIATAGNHSISYGGPSVLPYLLRRSEFGAWLRESRLSVCNNSNRWRGILMSSFEPWLPAAARNGLHWLFTGAPAQDEFDFRRAETSRPPSASSLRGTLAEDRFDALRQTISGSFAKGHLARTGVEERDPTADLRLVRFCLSMPPELLLKDGVYRPLARKALADRVPRAVLDAPRRGYQGADWYARLDPVDARHLLEEIEGNTSVQSLLDLDRLRATIDHWPALGSRPFATMFAFGRGVTQALAAGKFIVDIEAGQPV